MKRAAVEWRALHAEAPPLLLDYVEARGLFVFALRGFNAAAEALWIAEAAAERAFVARDTRRVLEGLVRDLRSRPVRLDPNEAPPRRKTRREREAELGCSLRTIGAQLERLPRRSDELRAWVALAEACDVFDAWARLVDEALYVVTRRHHAWRRWEAARDLAAANFGVEVCRYVPTERMVAE